MPPGDRAPPVYVHLHGGAFIMRHPRMDDFFARFVVAETGHRWCSAWTTTSLRRCATRSRTSRPTTSPPTWRSARRRARRRRRPARRRRLQRRGQPGRVRLPAGARPRQLSPALPAARRPVARRRRRTYAAKEPVGSPDARPRDPRPRPGDVLPRRGPTQRGLRLTPAGRERGRPAADHGRHRGARPAAARGRHLRGAAHPGGRAGAAPGGGRTATTTSSTGPTRAPRWA